VLTPKGFPPALVDPFAQLWRNPARILGSEKPREKALNFMVENLLMKSIRELLGQIP
jgi:hypothetical protein